MLFMEFAVFFFKREGKNLTGFIKPVGVGITLFGQFWFGNLLKNLCLMGEGVLLSNNLSSKTFHTTSTWLIPKNVSQTYFTVQYNFMLIPRGNSKYKLYKYYFPNPT